MARMVEVGSKPRLTRQATARGRLILQPATLAALKVDRLPKGQALTVAKVAAIQAVKATPTWLPLCHPIPITGVEVDIMVEEEAAVCRVAVRATYRTGVEMEALTGVAAGLLCLWDMAKPLEKDETGQYPHTRITDLEVVEKVKAEPAGGKP